VTTPSLDTDYLIIGSGAVGMAFADTLFHETDARMVIVDRHHGPGGHWNDAYPFVRLHQPSAYYGVNSKKLGTDSKDGSGINVGMYERASAAELVSYYEQVMRPMLASGRVRYFPMCDYTGDGRFKSLTSGHVQQVHVGKKIVDSTYLQTMVPSTTPPKYAIAEGVRCIPLNGLPRVSQPPSGYVVVGSGKTGIDACLWLLENGVDADAIAWIMPRDAWYLNRAKVQPGEEFFVQSYGGFAEQVEAIASAESMPDLFARLSASGQLLRIDETVTPTMFHSAIMSESEMLLLRQIKKIVRLGRVQQIEAHQIVLDRGTFPSDPDRLYVDCSASAIARRPIVPVFNGNTITPQFVRTVQPTFSAALIAHVEANYPDDGDGEALKNTLCRVIPLPDQPEDWLRMMAVNMGNQQRWSKDKALMGWIMQSRLDGFSALARSVKPTDNEKLSLLQRYGKSAGPALANMPILLRAAA
jgi:NAD(P)-binding Rossmann-like domain